jgi:hypothetical protein
MATNGIVLIKPSSITHSSGSASININGSISFSGVTSVSINGIFSSVYDNYIIDVRHVNTTDGRGVAMRLRSNGVDAQGNDYAFQRLDVNGTAVSGQRGIAGNSTQLFLTSTNNSGSHGWIYGPALAEPTVARSVNGAGVSGAYIYDYVWSHSLSTSYDGLTTLWPSLGAISGLIKVYGLVK